MTTEKERIAECLDMCIDELIINEDCYNLVTPKRILKYLNNHGYTISKGILKDRFSLYKPELSNPLNQDCGRTKWWEINDSWKKFLNSPIFVLELLSIVEDRLDIDIFREIVQL